MNRGWLARLGLTRLGLGAMVLGGAGPVQAPVFVPERDVAVTYQTGQGRQILQQQLHWSAAARRLRLDPPTKGMFVLVDYTSGTMDIVRDADKTFVEMTAPPTLPGLVPPAAGLYTREGTDEVAGLACTEWSLGTAGPKTRLCVTSDGVVLRVMVGERVMAAASAVAYAPQADTLFRVPVGYTRVTPPR